MKRQVDHRVPDSPKLSVFLSWSGPISQTVAETMYNWLPQILPFIKPWISSQNIFGGKQWTPQLEDVLKTCDASIFCFTSENTKSEWLHFEAGNLKLRADQPLLLPYLFHVSEQKLSPVFSDFQARSATEEGTLALLRDITHHAVTKGLISPMTIELRHEHYLPLANKWQVIIDKHGMPIETTFQLSAGLGLDFQQIIDENTMEIVITGQNLQTLIRKNFLAHLASLYEKNPRFKALIIMTKPDFFSVLADSSKERKAFMLQFHHTVSKLTAFKSSLPSEKQEDFTVYFHAGASSLSVIFRDPSSKTRGLAAIMPKWATDTEPGNRMFYLVDRANNDALFHRIFGHIGIMNDATHSKTLEQMEDWLRKYK